MQRWRRIDDADHRLADVEQLAFPRPLGESFHAAQQKVRTEAAAVVAQGVDRAVGGDQERQHVEALEPVVGHESAPRPGRRLDVAGDRRGLPASTVDQRLAVRSERAVVEQETRARARRHDATARILDVNHAVAGDAVRLDHRVAELLAAHRLHRVPPQLREPHRPVRCRQRAPVTVRG